MKKGIPTFVYFGVVTLVGIALLGFLVAQKKSQLTQVEQQVVDVAVNVGLNKDQFIKDFKSQEVRDTVDQQRKDVLAIIGSASTPTIFIDGKQATPALYEDFKKTVQDALNVRTDKKKPIEIVEYADFNCPACASFDPALYHVLSDFGKDISFTHKNLPFLKDSSYTYAYAFEAAKKQGKTYEMSANLYKLAREDTYDFATVIGLIQKLEKDGVIKE